MGVYFDPDKVSVANFNTDMAMYNNIVHSDELVCFRASLTQWRLCKSPVGATR